MKYILISIIMLAISGRANDKYHKVQSKIFTVQTKIHDVNHKIDELTILVDSLGFQLIEK